MVREEIQFDPALVLVRSGQNWDVQSVVPQAGELIGDVVRRACPDSADLEIRDLSDRDCSSEPAVSKDSNRVFLVPRAAQAPLEIKASAISQLDKGLRAVDSKLITTSSRLMAAAVLAAIPIGIAWLLIDGQGWFGPTIMARLVGAAIFGLLVALRVGIGGCYVGLMLFGALISADILCHFGSTIVTTIALIGQLPMLWPWMTKQSMQSQKRTASVVMIWSAAHLITTLGWVRPGEGGSLAELYICWWTFTAWFGYVTGGAITDAKLHEAWKT